MQLIDVYWDMIGFVAAFYEALRRMGCGASNPQIQAPPVRDPWSFAAGLGPHRRALGEEAKGCCKAPALPVKKKHLLSPVGRSKKVVDGNEEANQEDLPWHGGPRMPAGPGPPNGAFHRQHFKQFDAVCCEARLVE